MKSSEPGKERGGGLCGLWSEVRSTRADPEGIASTSSPPRARRRARGGDEAGGRRVVARDGAAPHLLPLGVERAWAVFSALSRESLVKPVLSELRAFQARRQADSEAGPGLGDQLCHQG